MQSIEIRVLIDRSGSMSSWAKKVVEGVNAYLKRVRDDSAGQGAYVRIVQFDDMGTDILRQGTGSEIQDLKPSEFVPRALTPLHDNVAEALTADLERGYRYVLVVFTDGLENASKGEYRKAQTLRELVEKKQKEGWVIIYLGANVDAWQQAEAIGIPPERAMNVHVQGNEQPAKRSWFGFGKGSGGGGPVASAFVAAAGLGLAYAMLRPGSSQASNLGFSEADRNASMGVDGQSKTWQQAVEEDVSGFNEPFKDMFSLPQDLQQTLASLPSDFDPLKGSMNENGEQSGGLENSEEVHTQEDREAFVHGDDTDKQDVRDDSDKDDSPVHVASYRDSSDDDRSSRYDSGADRGSDWGSSSDSGSSDSGGSCGGGGD